MENNQTRDTNFANEIIDALYKQNLRKQSTLIRTRKNHNEAELNLRKQ